MIHDSCYATNNLDILKASEFGSFYPQDKIVKKH